MINNRLYVFAFVVVALSTSCMADDTTDSDRPSDGAEQRTYTSPLEENNVEYASKYVDSSRFASLLVLRDVLARFEPDLFIGPPLPIEYGDPGEQVAAWEIGLHSKEDGSMQLLYVVEADTGEVHLICNRREQPDCG